MSKRILSLLLALVLVVCCVLGAPLAYATETTTTGSGFTIDTSSSNTSSASWWADVDIYSLFNSATSGYLLTCASSSFYCGLTYRLFSNSGAYAITCCSFSSLNPYTSVNFPLGELVTSLSPVASVGANEVFINYSNAYAHWLKDPAANRYFLTEDSYLTFDYQKYALGGQVIKNVGVISVNGTVTYGASIRLFIASSGDYSSAGLYSSDPAPSTSTVSTPTITYDEDAWNGWHYFEQGSAGPTLTIEAESPNNGTLSYQWYVYNYDTGAAQSISGATSNTYTLPTDTVGNFWYYCTVTNTYSTGYARSSVNYLMQVYSADSAAGDGITWQITDDGVLIISGNGMMPDYTRVADVPWYSRASDITSIVVSEGITRIGNISFQQLTNVTSVSLPNTLESIGSMAFYRCNGLTSVLVPEGVVSIGGYAFGGTGLVVASLPSTLVTLDYYAFLGCASLISLYCYAAAPPSNTSSSSIWSNNVALACVYVPYGTGDTYRNHEDWLDVAEYIVEMEPEVDPVDTIEELNMVVEKILAELEEMNSSTGLLAGIINAINEWGQAIVDAIGGMGDNLGEALTEAFVPSDQAMQEMSDNSEALIADRFGAVYEGAQMIDQWAGQLTVQTARPTLTVPAVTVNLAGVPFSFGGWDVAVVPEGFEFLADTCALVIDCIATIAFLNGMKKRLERVLEG